MIDFIIIGQGIAGSVLSYKLVNRGYSIQVVDAYSELNSTMASAGIMNPITGRSFVKTWKVETLWKEAIVIKISWIMRILKQLSINQGVMVL